jgi:hypothetical protein
MPTSSAADLARIVPTLCERLSPPLPNDPEEDRWRLLQAATDLLRSAATRQPLLVVLEDLHDADRGTVDLLAFDNGEWPTLIFGNGPPVRAIAIRVVRP